MPGTGRVVLGVAPPLVVEASGLAWSRSDADLAWTHNDSGDSARVIGLGWDGAVRAVQPLSGISAVDFEDIALGPDPSGGDALFVGDIGDNAGARLNVRVHRMPEPALAGVAVGSTLPGAVPASSTLIYPDGARDAEALLVDRATGDVLIITKREARSRVYRATAAQLAAGEAMMSFVGAMQYGGVVAADACDDGRTIVVKTYSAIRVHRSDGGLGPALLGSGELRPYVAEPQGEAVAANGACDAYATLSEGRGQPLARYGP